MSIMLTERAASHVKRFLETKGQGIGLRLGVKPTGCSGYAYQIEAAESVGAEDTVFESNGVTLIVDAKSLPYLSGTELDYVREGLNATFKFRNPNVKDTCGCGESFNV
ncbi:MAG: Iron-binding protein IscA [Chromatiales bacterium USCg_Taylor]|nr:MAG: Iron-binding protein IscA [Chromatiales bacterium USCg_Taylor]